MVMEWWVLGALANGLILVAYVVIAYLILGRLVRTNQLWSNKLALATGLIFLTGRIGHGHHLYHLLMPSLGSSSATGDGARTAFDWHLSVGDTLTAAVAVAYLSLRSRLGPLLRGAMIAEDLRHRQRQAIEINDEVLQGLVVAKLAFETGDGDAAQRALDDTMLAARSIVTELLGDEGSDLELRAGDLRRTHAARPVAPGTG